MNDSLSEMICMKVVHYMHNGEVKDYLSEPIYVNVAIKLNSTTTVVICKKDDVDHFLNSKIFLYKSKNGVQILKKIGSPRRTSISQLIFKIPMREYAAKSSLLLKDVREKLIVRNLLKDSDRIL